MDQDILERKQHGSAAVPAKLNIAVFRMICASCVRRVERAIAVGVGPSIEAYPCLNQVISP